MVKLFWTLVHYYHLLLCRPIAAWCAVEKEKNETIKNMKRQVFSSMSFRIAFLVCFWENVQFISYMACYYCVVRVGKHSNSHSQMFYKIDALKNLAIFTRKHLCWRFVLINFCFPVNIAKCLSIAFYVEYICEYEFFEYYAMLSFFFRSVLARHG